MDFLGNLLQRANVGVDPDVEFFRVQTGALVRKETVAGPNIDYYPLAGRKR
jgi:hypothetical protein